jgi:hypothetical protein
MTEEFEWDAAGRPSPGHPVLVILAGSAILVLLAVSSPRWLSHQPLTSLLIAGAVLALALWLIGFVLTVRRAKPVWIAGSLAILLAVGLGAGFGADMLGKSQARGDMTALAEVELGPDGAPTFPRDAEARGPISRLFVANMRTTAQEERDYATEVGKLGLGYLNSPYTLSQNPGVLARCGEIAAFKAAVTRKNARRQARLDAALAAIDKADLPEDLKHGARLMIVPGGSRDQLDAMLAQDIELLDSAQALCVLLAKRSWSNQGGYFGFAGVDRAAFDALDQRRREVARKSAELQRADKDRLLEGREIVRNLVAS